MADEHISFAAMVNNEVGPMAYTTHSRDFDLRSNRTAPVANGVGANLARLVGNALRAQRRNEVDREIECFLARSGGRITDSMEREIMWKVFASDWTLPQ
jgi:hypothetical protein